MCSLCPMPCIWKICKIKLWPKWKFYKTAVGNDEVMLSLLASCLDFMSAMSGRFYLIFQQRRKHVYIQKGSLVKAAWIVTLWPYTPESQAAGETLTNVFKVDLTLTALWWSLFDSPPLRPGQWNPADTLTQLREQCIVALRLLGVSLYGTALACRWQTTTMKMFGSWMTVSTLCCLLAKYKMMEVCLWTCGRTFYADMMTR